MKSDDSALAWVAIDFLCCILLVVYTLIAPPVQKTSSIDTLGSYAVVVHWADGSNDDVDLYVSDPEGHTIFFANRDEALMHLEHDDQGTRTSGAHKNGERVVFRGMVKGEYVANVHMYLKRDPGPTVVTIELWRLRGNDTLLYKCTVVLDRTGAEETAFRFDQKGRFTSDLPKTFVGAFS